MKSIVRTKQDELVSPMSWILGRYMDLPHTTRIGNPADLQAFDKELKADKDKWESEGGKVV